ncbi:MULTISPECIES: lactate racemase domain-containing protein [Halorussus]|uniref:lactate racemase domain-containing protein n=1 Tax=Halorussus TaxID=1070314 RepID=UPI0020A22412|nr:lactate racemase domain-containing protein [Halorussus vallis]USZ76793.1 lactate racemase domain-containing protein [Halorussus vallis]
MQIPYADATIGFSLPECDVTVAEPPGGDPVDPREAAEAAVENPHGPRLRDRVDPDDEVAVVVTDVTRATPDDVLADVLLAELRAGGVDREQVRIVVGLGLHRPMSDEELREALGEHADLAENHDAEAAREVGTVEGPDGESVAIELNPTVADADRVVSTGMVEPHQYAGFSGGAKTPAIGAGGESLIRYTHGPAMLSNEGVRLGRTEGNPFRETLNRAGDVIDLDFCLNVTHAPAGILDASAGDHRAVVADLAETARSALSVPVSGSYDAVVAGVGAPKDANLYQTTRAATYVALGDYDPLREGGRIVVPARLQEGAGEGTGEKRFYDRLSGAESASALYEEMRRGYDPGAQRAFVVARVLREYDLYVTNSKTPQVVGDCLMHASDSVEDAVEPGSDVLVVPDALDTLLVRA